MQKPEFDLSQHYHDFKVLVYNVALNYVQNIEDAEEITQDVFVKIFESWHKFQNNSSLKTWVYRISVNTSLDFIKHKNSKKRFYVFGKKSSSEKELLSFSNFEHPGIALENKENTEILFKIINLLNENQKTAFILSKLDGLSNSEIASIMEVSISSVESLIFRAKANLREKLSSKFDNYRKK